MSSAAPSRWTDGSMQARVRRRYAAERRFRLMGLAAVSLSVIFLAFLLVTMAWKGLGGFTRTEVALTVDFPRSDLILDPAALRGAEAQQAVADAGLDGILAQAAVANYGEGADELFGAAGVRALGRQLIADPDLLGSKAKLWLPASSDVDVAYKGSGDAKSENLVRLLESKNAVKRTFNADFLTQSDATDASAVGVWGALAGSFLTIVVTMLLAFPIGVLAAVYLEEFAPRNRWTDVIEVSINNLAAVPSIVFGLLGLALFINVFGLPRSAPVVGGLVLSLMTLPVIIIASRAALTAVPPSIREAALGLGASKMQMVLHHVLPLAMPGMLTGTIIGMARALGESAPLLMIGMVAFIVDVPDSPLSSATALPVQVYLWADSPERAFVERTSAAIVVLLVFLLLMNAAAILLRKHFERRY